jgi:hypothetical protein
VAKNRVLWTRFYDIIKPALLVVSGTTENAPVTFFMCIHQTNMSGCPPGMPPKVCERMLAKQQAKRPAMPAELRSNIRGAAKYFDFKRQPLEQRTKQLQNAWSGYVNSRRAIGSKSGNNDDDLDDGDNVHAFNNSNLEGGTRRARRAHRARKSRKTRKTRKTRKSRKTHRARKQRR